MLVAKLCLFACAIVAVFVQDVGALPPVPVPPAQREVDTSSGRVRGFLGPSGVFVFVQDVGALPPVPVPPAQREVDTSSGRVRGFLGPSGVFEFLDIPYASVPTGPHKFGPPLPPITWQDTLIATAKNIICPQPKSPFVNLDGKIMQEECLLTSVFVPAKVTDEKLPVVVYVHGGAFQIGEGNNLIYYDLVRDHNIVAVTFNYRLGAHGFLCLGTDDIPGNAGMKDQVALLRWVHNNIESFGGNPDDVTLAGSSAGSSSVDLLMLSKSAKGLFNKVIPESGANVAVFAVHTDPLESAKAFAKSLDFNNVDDIHALEEFYKSATFDQLNSDPTFLERPDGSLPFVPCVERPLPTTEQTGREVFLDKSPREILESGDYTKVPLLYGFTSMEGLLWANIMFDEWSAGMNESFLDFVPADLVFESEEERENVSQTIKQFYFGDDFIDTSKIVPFIHYYTDVLFAYPMQRSVRIQVKNGHNEIYLYEFNYDGENSTPVPYTDLRGADHCAQSMAIFGVAPFSAPQIISEEYRTLMSSIQQLWANFIKTGKPVIDGSNQLNLPTSWPPVSSNWSPYMSIGTVIQVSESPLLLSRTQFWEGIYEKYYREPVPPIPQSAVTELEVNTTSGWVRGFLGESGVFEFKDIPYATVPKGHNKFGPPLPPITWEDTLNATAKNIVCPQPITPIINIEGKIMQEECLLASVFVPATASEEKLPVVVYVHGGAFQIGGGNRFIPYDLVRDHNIVGVTFNYRLGANGFLCLGTDDIPGNAGMKDQVALLRWVQNNIASFGGNPEDVTLAGSSAGSAAADLLMLSKSTEGLFNKVIPESGANIANIAVHSDPLESAKAFAKSLDFYNVDDIHALEEFYKTATFDQLNSDSTLMDRPDGSLPFVPCVERPLSNTEQTGREVFLDKSPREILESGDFTKLPLLYGFANMEGSVYIDMFETWKTEMNENFTNFLPADLIFESSEERENVSQTIKQFYFDDGPIQNSNIINYIDYYSDTLFAYPMQRSARIQAQNGHNDIYLYEFNYVDENSFLIPYTDVRGAEHCGQTMAVFNMINGGGNGTMTEEYRQLVASVQQIWANFIKTGKPIVEGSNHPNLPTSWPPVSSNWSPYMSIGNVIELKESPLLLNRTQFWEGIYEKYYREPRPPIPVEAEGNLAGRNSAWISFSVLTLLTVFRGRFVL